MVRARCAALLSDDAERHNALAVEGVVDEAIIGDLVGIGMALADLFEDFHEALYGGIGGLVGIGRDGFFLSHRESRYRKQEQAPHGGSMEGPDDGARLEKSGRSQPTDVAD